MIYSRLRHKNFDDVLLILLYPKTVKKCAKNGGFLYNAILVRVTQDINKRCSKLLINAPKSGSTIVSIDLMSILMQCKQGYHANFDWSIIFDGGLYNYEKSCFLLESNF